MRKFLFWSAVIFAVMMVISLSMTGTQAQALPQTITHNSVRFVAIEEGLPKSTKLIHFGARGQITTQQVKTTRVKVGLVCPENGDQRLSWIARGSAVAHVETAGKCIRVPSNKAVFVSVLKG